MRMRLGRWPPVRHTSRSAMGLIRASPIRERDEGLMIEQKARQVRAGVAFAARAVMVAGPEGRDAVGTLCDVLQKAGLLVVDEESRIRVQQGDQDDTVANAAHFYGGPLCSV